MANITGVLARVHVDDLNAAIPLYRELAQVDVDWSLRSPAHEPAFAAKHHMTFTAKWSFQ